MDTRNQMLERSTTELGTLQAAPAQTQPRRLQVALVLLLVALAFVFVKERDFWFGPSEVSDSDVVIQEHTAKPSSPVQAPSTSAVSAPAPAAKKQHATKTTSATAAAPAVNPDSNSPIVATNRTVLPPLEVEVVAGDSHSVIRPGSNVAKVEILNDSNRASTAAVSMAGLPANAAERAHLSGGSVHELRQAIDTTYPLLGQHSRVQGSVVLQAIVGADGTIEDLRVVSGPSILSAAAQQAVRQWRFKPYLQNGQPVETKATITVNFSIRIADNTATTS